MQREGKEGRKEGGVISLYGILQRFHTFRNDATEIKGSFSEFNQDNG
jgi:hypothetical protein